MEPHKRNNEFIKELLSKKEGLHLDFKQSLTNPAKIARNILAFANTEGGTLVIGASDKGELIGIDVEEERFMVEQAILNHCRPLVKVGFETFEIDYWEDQKLPQEKQLLLVHVPKSKEGPHLLDDKKGKLLFFRRIKDKSLLKQVEDYS
ncbi:AlbA family DNA-binding domain-containing protein [Pleomorphovibrio marinus]|uniref:AlbA family DNA-binding domain-containing protein n=1 Tax=Pleomorphovibrio marinus TaxID=2164132 RepID=UPI000E0C1266|nr:ATP-binding protein [Pleomorphovibrio marinus]